MAIQPANMCTAAHEMVFNVDKNGVDAQLTSPSGQIPTMGARISW